MPRHAERAWLWLAVAGLHGLLLLALRDAVLPRSRAAAPVIEPLWLGVRLIPPLPLPLPAPAATAPVAANPATQPSQPRVPRAEPRAEPRAAAVGHAITITPTVDEAPSAASAPAARPVNLSVPRALAAPAQPSMRDQVINDPRSSTPRATVESRVAAVAGSVEIVEERMDATRMRVKQHGGCVEVHVSRNAQIDPFNQSVAPTPKVVKPSC